MFQKAVIDFTVIIYENIMTQFGSRSKSQSKF